MYYLTLANPLASSAEQIRKHPFRKILLFTILISLGLAPTARAQTGGEGGIQGTVSDSTGAAVPNALVTATNVDTGISTKRETTGAGLYTISPILPGTYTVTVTAQGFQTVMQKNLTVNALTMTPLDLTLSVGGTSTEVTVTAAPPQLETTNATLGLTIENAAYSNLPLIMNNAQRDPTAFGALAPGAQGAPIAARLPVIGGTGNYLGQLYLDGLPAQTVSQQGDNRLVSQSITVDAVDQMQVVTSTPPAEYSGAGAMNFTMKSGGLQYHGSAAFFLRNTALDAWQFNKGPTKPVDHQNELAVTIGGHVPGTKRLFFFFAYDRFHSRTFNNPVAMTIPTPLELGGDFTELNGGVGTGGLTGTGTNNPPFLYDPTTTSCSGGSCTRQPFMGMKNGIPTYNVIPSNYISPIAQGMQQWIPTPTNPNSLTNNYSAGSPAGFDNHLYDWRVDFDVNSRNRISTVGAMGTVNYLNNFNAPYLPLPYTGGDLASIYPKVFDVEWAYTISNSLVNQLKYGYTRFFQNIHNTTQGSPTYAIGKFGITNLPLGQAGDTFPGATFNATTKFGSAVQYWTGTTTAPGNSVATQLTTPNNFAIVDNLQWVKGRHSLTFGASVQWQQINNANPATYTGVLGMMYNGNSTAQFVGNSLSTTSTGYAYASYLLGAVGNNGSSAPSLGLQPVSEVGGRYFTVAPYAEDVWKVNSKLTINAGVRWDYLPPYHEVLDRWSFLNPNITNPATGSPGALQFAGNYGGAGVSCGCRTPVQTYWKNWGPRVGITYQTDAKTVFRVGAGRVFSQGGGVGGRGGAFNGTGQLGFNTTAIAPAEVTTGSTAGPSFYLNNSSYFQSLGIANTALGFTYPSAPTIGPASQILNTGHYVNSTTGKFVTPSTMSYADPYFSSRAPDFMFYNAGMQHAFTNNLTLAINYVGNQSHHLINSTNTGTGTARGYWSNQLNPTYLVALGSATDSTGKLPLLTAPANAANIAKAQSIMPGINIPPYFEAAANLPSPDTNATIAQGLVTFPQYSGVSDTWGNVGNFSYNSLQVTVQQRLAYGLTFNFNYTWSRNVGDDGPYRTGFALPSGAVSGTSQSYRMNRIDRSETTVSAPNIIHLYGVWGLPFGRGHSLGSGNAFVSALVSGWQLSGIYSYSSGTPVQITYAGCTTPLQGQCMPDLTTAYAGPARVNGGYGSGPTGRTAANLGKVQYFNVNSFQKPVNINQTAGVTLLNLIGNAPRTGALGLRNPPQWDIDTGVRRSFPLYRERVAFVFEANAFNTINHTLFSNPNAVWGLGSTSFGTISSASNKPRAFEFAGHLNF